MLIGLLIKCLSGPIHIVLWHPQLLFNLCPAIVHLFNWLKVRRSGKGSSSPYQSTAQCDANYSHCLVELNDEWHDFHCRKNKKKKQSTTEVSKSADHLSRSSDVMFPIETHLLKQKETSNCYLSRTSHQYTELLPCDLFKDGSISFLRPVVTNKNRSKRSLG